MNRFLVLAVIWLTTGAIANASVAWGCRLAFQRLPSLAPSYQGTSSAKAWWKRHKPEGVRDDLAGFAVAEGFGCRRITYTGDAGGTYRVLPSGTISIFRSSLQQELPQSTAHVVSAGLPMKSFQGQHWLQCERSPAIKVKTLKMSGLTGNSPRALPYWPIWPGLGVNTVFYAVVLWLMTGGPFVLRRFTRRKRGLCPECAYPMGEATVCTECGRPLPERKRLAVLVGGDQE